MFELKYAVTESDIKAENKKIALFYFLLYFTVAVIGLGAGIAAVVINPEKSVLVLGIIILVFAGMLLAISLLMMIAPKNLVSSVLPPSDGEQNVVIDKNGITVDGSNLSPFADITAIKNRKTYLVVYFGKDKVFLVKNAITSGQSLAELYAYMTERQGKLLLTQSEEKTALQQDSVDGNSDNN